MIIIALAFLGGILFIFNKILSFIIFSFIIFIVIKRRMNVSIFIISIVFVITGYSIINHHLKTQESEIRYFAKNEQINQYVHFDSNHFIKNQKLNGTISLNHQTYPYTILLNHNVKVLENIDEKTCKINGKFYNYETNNPMIYVEQIDFATCYDNKQANIFDKHLSFIKNKIIKSGIQEPYRILALITGETKQLNDNIKENAKLIGIYHLLAVSGSHVGAISFIIYQIFLRFNCPLPVVKAIVILFLIIFAYYTDFAPSALRAILSSIIFILLPSKLKSSPINVLAIVFLVMVIFTPSFIFDIGFQFSFLISFFIILSLPYLANLNKFKSLLAITFIAQIGSLIVTIVHFNQVQWIGLFSNIIFVPYYTFFLFPLTIIFFIFAHLNINLYFLKLLLELAFKIHDYIEGIFIKLSKLQWNFPEISDKLTSLLVLTIIATFLLFIHRHYFKSIIIIVIVLLLIPKFSDSQSFNSITFLNVGQGDSILYKTKYNETVLVDTGGKIAQNKQLDNHNIAKYHIIPSLRKHGVSKINYYPSSC